MKSRLSVILGAVVLAFAAGLIWLPMAPAQPAASPGPNVGEPKKLGEPKKAKKDDDEIRIDNADQGRYDAARDLFYLSGNVVFRDEDVKLYCDEASYNNNDDTAACAGNLRIVDPENTITGKRINADFTAEMAVIEGDVKIVTTKTTKAQESKEPKKRITTITCDRVVYYYTEGERRAIATGNLKGVQEDKTVTAQRADYDREKDVIVLSPEVIFTMKSGTTFACRKATISVTDDWINMEGLDRGLLKREKEETAGGEEPAPGSEEPAPGGSEPTGEPASDAGEPDPDAGDDKPDDTGSGATLKSEEKTE